MATYKFDVITDFVSIYVYNDSMSFTYKGIVYWDFLVDIKYYITTSHLTERLIELFREDIETLNFIADWYDNTQKLIKNEKL